ncbi:uncharacterized protein TM35_000501450 [Trypanosoma theileri]|uniref:Uncharacterized protein n=1 Tax=Trypanosoma theileri TaxID=67003 RepID=A0A1X0NHM1_9TRYP|nr:uncharacterized protein TM35_000501450 [Trypanosoma theileri]ORC84091.1 hypothetical protein TM35_000501450 [Trypanosoma theileri]
MYLYNNLTSEAKEIEEKKEEKLQALNTIHKTVEASFNYTDNVSLDIYAFDGIHAEEDAQTAARKAEAAVKPAETAANLLNEALGNLTTAINTAKKRIEEITPEENKGSPNNTGNQSVPSDSTTNKQPSPASTTAVSGSEETNSTTTPPSSENTTTETPNTTPSPSPNVEINTIASTVKKNANADSSVSPVWMRTAAPLLIVVVLFSATLY